MNEFMEFEKKHGSIALLKLCNSALNELLIRKGILTREEIHEAGLEELRKHKEDRNN